MPESSESRAGRAELAISRLSSLAFAGLAAFHSLVTYSGRFLASHSDTANPPGKRSAQRRVNVKHMQSCVRSVTHGSLRAHHARRTLHRRWLVQGDRQRGSARGPSGGQAPLEDTTGTLAEARLPAGRLTLVSYLSSFCLRTVPFTVYDPTLASTCTDRKGKHTLPRY